MKLNEQILARYYDGELNAKDAEAVKRQLDASPENAQALHQMENMSNLFKVMSEEKLNGVSFDGFDKRVLNEIRNQKKVAPLAERIGVWLREFFEHRKQVWIPTASLAGAACAALLAIGLSTPSGPVAPTMPTMQPPERWEASVHQNTVASIVTIVNSSEVDAQALRIETDSGQQIGVVWIND